MRRTLTSIFFFFNDTATTEIYTLSLHDALPIPLSGRDFTLSLRAGPTNYISARVRAKRNDRIEKTCQHSAMKHRKQNRRAPQAHPSALAVPSYHRILVKHGLIEKTLSIPDAYAVFLKVGADPEVQKLRRKEIGRASCRERGKI